MRTHTMQFLMCIAIMSIASRASGQIQGIYAEFFSAVSGWLPVPGFPNANEFEPGLESGSSVSIFNANDVPYRIYAISPTTTDIGNIFISAASSAFRPRVFIGRGLTFPSSATQLPVPGCRNIGAITHGTGRIRLQVNITGNINGPVTAHEIVRIDASGVVAGNITHDPDQEVVSMGRVIAGAFAPGFFIRATRGDVSEIRSTTTILSSSIDVAQGRIANIIANSSIGNQSAPITIQAAAGFGQIACENFYGSITAGANGNFADIDRITVSTDFTGTIDVRTFSGISPVVIDGDFDGNITLTEELSSSTLVRIGGSLLSGASINLPPSGLAGQIVVNNNDAGGEWLGDVNVGAAALADPMYTATAASLGGGSIGKAPFGLHDESCTPINGFSIAVSPTTIETVRMRYYGPLDDGGVSAGGGTPFTVDRRTTIPTGSWTPVSAASFSSAIVGNEVVITEATSGAFEPGFQYRFTATSALKSAGVAGTPIVLAEPYIVGMVTQGTGGGGGSCEDCLVCLEICELGLEMVGPGPDFNGDGVVGAYDLQLMIAAMGKSGGKADLNGDGVVDNVDLELFLTVYGSGEQVSSE